MLFPAPPRRQPLGSPHASSASTRCSSLLRLVAGLLVRRTLPLPRRGGRKLPHTRRPRSKSTKALCSSTKSKYARSDRFQVDEGDLFPVADAPHGGRKRPRCCSVAKLLFSPLTLFMAAPGGRVTALMHGGRKRPRCCSAEKSLFSSLTLLMAAPGGRVLAESRRVKERDSHGPPLLLLNQKQCRGT